MLPCWRRQELTELIDRYEQRRRQWAIPAWPRQGGSGAGRVSPLEDGCVAAWVWDAKWPGLTGEGGGARRSPRAPSLYCRANYRCWTAAHCRCTGACMPVAAPALCALR